MRDVRDREKEGEKWQARRAVSDMVGLLLESHIRGLVDDLEPDPEPWICASLHPPGPPPLGGSDSRLRCCLPARGQNHRGPQLVSTFRVEARRAARPPAMPLPSHGRRDGWRHIDAERRGTLGGFGQHTQWVAPAGTV